LKLLWILGDSVTGKFDLLAGPLCVYTTYSRPNDILSFTFVENTSWAAASPIVIAFASRMLWATELSDLGGHDFTDHFSDVSS
jgi:hypothetical protein